MEIASHTERAINKVMNALIEIDEPYSTDDIIMLSKSRQVKIIVDNFKNKAALLEVLEHLLSIKEYLEGEGI